MDDEPLRRAGLAARNAGSYVTRKPPARKDMPKTRIAEGEQEGARLSDDIRMNGINHGQNTSKSCICHR